MKLLNKTQSGRSMVEMLGVLAIIGVLSVGGIAGYSKAMNKYKISKTTDQVSMLIANIRTMFSAQGDYKGLTTSSAISFGVIPDDMVKTVNGSQVVNNAFGGTVIIHESGLDSTDDGGAFVVIYNGLSQEACVSIVTGDWGSSQSSGLIAVGASMNAWDESQALVDSYLGGDGFYYNSGEAVAQPGGGTVPTPMPVSVAVIGCKNTNPENVVAWKYY